AAAYALAWVLPWNLQGWRAHLDFVVHVARYPRSFPVSPPGFTGLGGAVARALAPALGWPVLLGLALAIVCRASPGRLRIRAIGALTYVVAFIGAIGYVYPGRARRLIARRGRRAARSLAWRV